MKSSYQYISSITALALFLLSSAACGGSESEADSVELKKDSYALSDVEEPVIEQEEFTPLARPICLFEGTRSEGWYWEDLVEIDREDALIRYAFCSEAEAPRCDAIGSRSEGWYAENWTDTHGTSQNRIIWDQCRGIVGYALMGEECGEDLGLQCHDPHNIMACIDGICQYRLEPHCVTYETAGEEEGSLGNFHAVNVSSFTEARAILRRVGDYRNESISEGACFEMNAMCPQYYLPVCGTMASTSEQSTFSNICFLKVGTTLAAGQSGQESASWTMGACENLEN